MEKETKKFKVGDWVRFYRNGQLVMGVVQYIHQDEFSDKQELSTDNGAVDSDMVLERRPII